jgi:hypothetical protein
VRLSLPLAYVVDQDHARFILCMVIDMYGCLEIEARCGLREKGG